MGFVNCIPAMDLILRTCFPVMGKRSPLTKQLPGTAWLAGAGELCMAEVKMKRQAAGHTGTGHSGSKAVCLQLQKIFQPVDYVCRGCEIFHFTEYAQQGLGTGKAGNHPASVFKINLAAVMIADPGHRGGEFR